jgi:hypothetical protein
MWASLVIAAVALAGAAFMLRFLIALLRDRAPSVCYCVVPVRPELKRREVLRSDWMDDGRWSISKLPAVRPLGKTGPPGNRIFFTLRIEPPWQS